MRCKCGFFVLVALTIFLGCQVEKDAIEELMKQRADEPTVSVRIEVPERTLLRTTVPFHEGWTVKEYFQEAAKQEVVTFVSRFDTVIGADYVVAVKKSEDDGIESEYTNGKDNHWFLYFVDSVSGNAGIDQYGHTPGEIQDGSEIVLWFGRVDGWIAFSRISFRVEEFTVRAFVEKTSDGKIWEPVKNGVVRVVPGTHTEADEYLTDATGWTSSCVFLLSDQNATVFAEAPYMVRSAPAVLKKLTR